MAEKDSVLRSIPASRLRWDVFLSFRGADTRDIFTQHLYAELDRNGVRVFRDNDGLRRGDSLDPTLFEAIEDSAASIAIISPNYASSRWCLEELTKICECSAEYRLILPVFYGVDPSDVRRQSGPFEAHFRKHESRYGEEVAGKWREAMRKVGGISGWVYTNSEAKEHQLIRSLLKRILDELRNTPEVVAPYIVGLDSRVEELMRLLDVKYTGLQVLGIYGMGGIGKTTLAKALYNKLVSHFVHRSFVSNVRENSLKQKGFMSLQKKLISDLSAREAPLITDDIAGKKLIKTVLHEKQVLVVLDDIDDVYQLNALAGRREWFSDGSRIIISTRDREVLPASLVNEIYEVKVLDSSDSLKLFSYHALRRAKPTKTLMDFSLQIVSLTGGLPLALEVFGSSLFGKRIEEWQDALQKLKLIRPYNLQDILKISFDGLDEQVKCIFLDIACILLNPEMTREYAVDVMKGCGFSGETGIATLIARSLVKVIGDDTLWMHDQIRDMGRQIVMHENLIDPGLRSRLWNHNEVLHVLKSWKGTRKVQGITLTSEMKSLEDKNAPTMASALSYLKEMYNRYFRHGVEEKGGLIFNTKQFGLMADLRLLQFMNVRLEGDFKHLPAELRWLQWKNCTLKCLPSGCPRELTVLDLSESSVERVWNCRWLYTNKVAEKLIVLNLRKCFNLATTPDLSGNLALEKLILARCVRLTGIHKSVADLNTLRLLDLSDCDNLVEFPGDVSGLKRLEKLILSGCSKLSDLPQNIGSMSSLRQLLLDNTSIEKLPDSIFRLIKLEKLSLKQCKLLKKLPDCMGMLDSLSELHLDGSALVELPESIRLLANLEVLSLMWCRSLVVLPNDVGDIKLLTKFWLNDSGVEELPTSVGTLSYLRNLSVGGCHQLSKLPSSIRGLASLVELQLDGTSIIDLPDEIGDMKSLRELQMRNCLSLRSLPETIGFLWALENLIIVDAAIVKLPENIGMLQNLIMLRLNKCKLLCSLPDSIGELRSLCRLFLDKTAVTELPESFGMLSNLVTLIMSNNSSHEVPQNSEGVVEIKPKCIALPSSFSKLSSLVEFNARAWNISANIEDDFKNLSSLEMLDLSRNNFCSLPSSLRELSCLKKLLLAKCKQLKVLPLLPSSLEELDALDCVALEEVSDLKNLKNLIYLSLTNCAKLMDIPGLECLKSLRRLHIGGCNFCSSAVKAKLDKVALKNLREASMPGSEIPDWFTHKMVHYSKRKHQELKAVIIGVVVSVNHQILDDFRDEQIVLVDIQAKIFRRDKEIFATVLPLAGVPKTDQDQFYLCRYVHGYPLFSSLEDGDMIEVAIRDPPFTKGVELNKCGLHLVFEYDDDYDGEEKALDESQQSVSEKLTRFLNDENPRNDSIPEDESKMQGREHKKVCFRGLLVLSLLLLGLFIFVHFQFWGVALRCVLSKY